MTEEGASHKRGCLTIVETCFFLEGHFLAWTSGSGGRLAKIWSSSAITFCQAQREGAVVLTDNGDCGKAVSQTHFHLKGKDHGRTSYHLGRD